MADYNENTNWDNERKYLTNMANGLRSDGSPASPGEQAWAKGQMNVLENAYERYNSSSNSNVSANDQVLASVFNDTSQYISQLYSLFDSVNAQAIEQAERQNQFQIEQNAKAMEFNSAEAQKNRDWQEYMSNTAHQREVDDLKAAGLNPVLSAMGGNGAPVGSGATAQGVTSAGAKADLANNSLINLIGTIYSAKIGQQNAELSARTALQNAQINAQASEYIAGVQAAASKYVANTNYGIQQSREAHDVYMSEHYPDNIYQLGMTLLNQLLNDKDKAVSTGTAKSRADFGKSYNSSQYKTDPLNSKALQEMIDALR